MALVAFRSYSFIDIVASITGPGGTFSLGDGAGPSEEGIAIERADDKDMMVIGADGSGMHSLHAGRPGSVLMRYLKTSPVNAQLQAMYDFQSLSSANWGQNIITVVDIARGDTTVCRGCAFRRFPSVTYAKDATLNEWGFNVIAIDTILGG